MKERLEKVCSRLSGRPGLAFCGWFGGRPADDGLVGLEFTHLVVALVADGRCLGFRFAGTLELNELDQQRVLFAGESLVRIVNGPRRNLVVRPYNLRYEESSVPAGLEKELAPGTEPWRMSFHRDGDIGFLGQLEGLILERPAMAVETLPAPVPYKRVLDLGAVQPIVNGRLVARLKELEDMRTDEPVNSVFARHIRQFCEARDGGYMFPLGSVICRGRTVLDLTDMRKEAYLVPAKGLDVATEIFRTDILKPIERKEAPWNRSS